MKLISILKIEFDKLGLSSRSFFSGNLLVTFNRH
jgi:hypothetical protein